MKATELRDKTTEELIVTEGDLKREVFNLRFQIVTGEIQNPRRIREAKREIARVKTIINEKACLAAIEEGASAPKEKGSVTPKEEEKK